MGQWPGRPVNSGVFFCQGHAHDLFCQGGQTKAFKIEQARGEFGVEEGVGAHPFFGQAPQVLRCCMEDPFDPVQGGVDGRQDGERL